MPKKKFVLSPLKKKKSSTKWMHEDYGPRRKTWIKIGLVSHPEESCGYKYDCVRLQIRSAWKDQETIDFAVRLDEATSISAGFLKVLDIILRHGKKELHDFADGHKKETL